VKRGYLTAPLDGRSFPSTDDAIWAEWNPLRTFVKDSDSGYRKRSASLQNFQQNIASTNELALCLKLISEFGQPVLDLCCGTGRYSLALAESGVQVTGCDYNECFIEVATSRTEEMTTEARTHVRFVHKDARNLNLGQRFSVIICLGYAFQSFLTIEDQLRCLSSVRHHMVDSGVFLVNQRFRWSLAGKRGRESQGLAPFGEHEFVCSVLYDPIEQIQFCYVADPEVNDDTPKFYEAIRWMSWQEMVLLHQIAGFKLKTVYHCCGETRLDAWLVFEKSKRKLKGVAATHKINGD